MTIFTTPILVRDFVPLHLVHLECSFVLKDPWVVPNIFETGYLEPILPLPSHPLCLIYTRKKPLHSWFHSWDLVLPVDEVVYPMGGLEPILHRVHPSECSNISLGWHSSSIYDQSWHSFRYFHSFQRSSPWIGTRCNQSQPQFPSWVCSHYL